MRMMTVLKASALALAATLMVGCGERVEVPPGHVGKIMTKDGYQDNLIPTSKLRLPACITYCDRLVVLNATDRAYVEEMTILIPEDKLNINVAIKATLSVDPSKTDALFNKLPQTPQTDYFSVIDGQAIYTTYGQQVLQAEVRAYLTKFTISEIASNNERINAELGARLTKVMSERTPFKVSYVGMTKIAYPKIITDAQENAAKRREAIQQEEAQLQVSKVQLERELQEARLQREIEKEKATTEAIKQRTVAETITPQYLRMKELEIEQTKADKWDGRQPQTLVTGSGASNSLIMDMRK